MGFLTATGTVQRAPILILYSQVHLAWSYLSKNEELPKESYAAEKPEALPDKVIRIYGETAKEGGGDAKDCRGLLYGISELAV